MFFYIGNNVARENYIGTDTFKCGQCSTKITLGKHHFVVINPNTALCLGCYTVHGHRYLPLNQPHRKI